MSTTDQDERLERLAEAYATHQNFLRKGEGDCRDSYDTLMKYEVRGYVSDAWLAGYRARDEEVRGLAELIYGLIDQCNSVAWNDISEAPAIIRNLEAALARFREESNGA